MKKENLTVEGIIEDFKSRVSEIYNDYDISNENEYQDAIYEIIDGTLPTWNDDINAIFIKNMDDIEDIDFKWNNNISIQDNIIRIVYIYLSEKMLKATSQYKNQ